jgi:flagellar L-ring protein precursor FlgH
MDVTALLGLVPAIQASHPNIDPSQLLSMLSTTDFSGDGSTNRKGTLKGQIAVRVREVMPNGDLFVEGTKVVMINNEENHLYVSGLIRTSDIARDNSVPSSRLADAQVEFTGRGDMADTVDRGWFAKILDAINPF